MKNRRKGLKNFFGLLKTAKLPWDKVILYILVSLLITTATASLPELAGDIMAGDIFNNRKIAIYVGATILTEILTIGTSAFQAWITYQVDRNLQKTTAFKFIHLPMSNYQEITPGSLISRVTNDTSNVGYLLFYTMQMFEIIYILALYTGIVFSICSKMALMFILIIPWSVFV